MTHDPPCPIFPLFPIRWCGRMRLVIVGLAALVGVRLAAQDAATDLDESLSLSPLVVKARRDRAADEVGGIEALATDAPLEPTSERIADLFQRVPGLITQDSFGGFDPPRLAVRGSGIQSAPTSRGLMIFFNGMPLNFADGSFNLTLLESAWMESADLIRGPAAGVPALGGSLVLDSAADLFVPGWSARAAYGSDETAALSASGAGKTGELALHGRAAYSSTEGWRPHSNQERECVFAAVRRALGADVDLTIQVLGSRPWYEVPGPLTKEVALTNPEAPVPAVMRDLPSRETDYIQFSARATKRWTDSRVSLTLGGVGFHDEFRQLAANGISVTDAGEAYLGFSAEKDWGAAKVWNLLDQRTRVNFLLQSGWWDASRYRNDHGNKGALIGVEDLQPLTLTTAVEHRVALAADQHLEFGGSVLTAKRGINDRFAPGPGVVPVDLGFSGSRFAPRVAWSWSPLAAATVVLSWARSYEPPTYNDLLYTASTPKGIVLRSAPLDWQRADSYEISAHGRYERFSWSGAIYHALWRDEFLRLANADGSSRGTVNADRTIHNGFESAVEWELLRDADTALSFWSTYNYSNARFDDDPVYGDRKIAGVPPHIGAVGLRAEAFGGWFVVPGVQWRAGETYADHANTAGYGGCGLWSVEIGRRKPGHWSMSIAVQNIFDTGTIASTAGVLDRAPAPRNTAIYLPAPERSVACRLEYAW